MAYDNTQVSVERLAEFMEDNGAEEVHVSWDNGR